MLGLAAGLGCRTAQPTPGPANQTARPATSDNPRPNAPGDLPGVAGIGGDSGTAPAGRGGGGGANAAPRPYNRVITAQAKTKTGVFKTHRVGNQLLYEIPRSQLGKDFLMATRISQTTLGAGYGGTQVDDMVLRWERRDNRVLLRGVSYSIVADTALPIAQAVAASNYNPIIAAFNVEAYGPDSAPVIDVTRLFTTNIPEFGPGSALRGNLDATRTFLESVATFPENIEVEAAQTYMVTPTAGRGGGGGPAGGAAPPPRAAAIVMHWSMV